MTKLIGHRYRIIKVTYENDRTYYYVQRECKHLHKYIFWGPKIWKTYEEIYDGCGSTHTGWSFTIKCGSSFHTEDDARNELIGLRSEDKGKIIRSINVVSE